MDAMLQFYCPQIERKGRAEDIKRLVGRLRGVRSVQTDLALRRVTVYYDSSRVAYSVILRLLGRVGFCSP